MEPGDLQSEGFLVLADLIERWPGEDRFGVYVVHVFPRRLRVAARRLAGLPIGRRMGPTIAPVGFVLRTTGSPGTDSGMIADESWEATQAIVLLEIVASRLPDERRQRILLWHIRDGQSLTQIARGLGLSRRQVHRIWNDIAAWARDNLAA